MKKHQILTFFDVFLLNKQQTDYVNIKLIVSTTN